MHVKVKINIVVCCQFDMDFSAPISKNFDSQGMAASRAAHFPHILRASRQMTAAARHNATCRRVFCALNMNLNEGDCAVTFIGKGGISVHQLRSHFDEIVCRGPDVLYVVIGTRYCSDGTRWI